MANSTNETYDDFNYEYTVDSLFKSGNYECVFELLNGTERAICKLLAKDGVSIKTVAIYLGFEDSYIKEIVRFISGLCEGISDKPSIERGR